MRTSIVVAAAALLLAFNACSDDDGTNVLPNGPPGVGGGGSGGSAGGGAGGTGGGGTGGAAGTGGSGVGGSGGAAGCTVTPPPDAGTDAGALDAGPDAVVDGGDPDASGSGAPGVVSFAGDIHPLFVAKCGPCHVTDFSGGHNVGGELTQAYAVAVSLGQVLVQRLDGGGMPPPDAPPPNDCGAEGRGDQPGDEGCLSVDEVALVQAWIDQCYPQ